MTKTNKMTALAAGVLIAALALTACAPKDNPPPVPGSTGTGGTASASQSATPSPGASVPPPANADEAKARAWDVVKAYWALRDQIMKDKGANPDKIKALANDPAASDAITYAQAVAKKGDLVTGERKATMVSAYTSDLITPKVPNGFVGMKVCNDVNDYVWTEANGTPIPRPQITRSIFDVNVTYDTTKNAWRVTDVNQPSDVKPC